MTTTNSVSRFRAGCILPYLTNEGNSCLGISKSLYRRDRFWTRLLNGTGYYRNHTLWIQWTIESILLTGAFTKSDERANPESSLDIRKEKERDEIDWRAWCYQLFNSYYVEISGRGIEEERELGLLSSLSNYSMSLVVILVVLFFTILSSKTMKMGLTALSKDNLVLNVVEWDQ